MEANAKRFSSDSNACHPMEWRKTAPKTEFDSGYGRPVFLNTELVHGNEFIFQGCYEYSEQYFQLQVE
jgi:hypothetical protein